MMTSEFWRLGFFLSTRTNHTGAWIGKCISDFMLDVITYPLHNFNNSFTEQRRGVITPHHFLRLNYCPRVNLNAVLSSIGLMPLVISGLVLRMTNQSWIKLNNSMVSTKRQFLIKKVFFACVSWEYQHLQVVSMIGIIYNTDIHKYLMNTSHAIFSKLWSKLMISILRWFNSKSMYYGLGCLCIKLWVNFNVYPLKYSSFFQVLLY